jgi:hypothetical protein
MFRDRGAALHWAHGRQLPATHTDASLQHAHACARRRPTATRPQRSRVPSAVVCARLSSITWSRSKHTALLLGPEHSFCRWSPLLGTPTRRCHVTAAIAPRRARQHVGQVPSGRRPGGPERRAAPPAAVGVKDSAQRRVRTGYQPRSGAICALLLQGVVLVMLVDECTHAARRAGRRRAARNAREHPSASG